MKVEMKVVTMRPKGVHELIAEPWCLLRVYLNSTLSTSLPTRKTRRKIINLITYLSVGQGCKLLRN